MKKIAVTFVLFIACNFISAQALDKGSFSFNLGVDAGVHGTEYTSYFNDNLAAGPDTSAAGTTLVRLNAQYSFVKWFSAGLDFRAGNYLEDPDNMEADGNSVSLFAISARFYPVNRDKFNWFLGTSFGRSRLEINRKMNVLSIPLKYNFSSGHFGLETGINWYIIKKFGINFNLGYMRQNYAMNEFRINGNEQDLSNFENSLKTLGVNVGLGFSFHF
jgi:hypothetical protein